MDVKKSLEFEKAKAIVNGTVVEENKEQEAIEVIQAKADEALQEIIPDVSKKAKKILADINKRREKLGE